MARKKYENYVMAARLVDSIPVSDNQKHSIGVRVSHHMKKGYLVAGEDYEKVQRKDLRRYGLHDEGNTFIPSQMVNILTMSGAMKVLDFEVEKERLSKKDRDKVIQELFGDVSGIGGKEKEKDREKKEEKIEVNGGSSSGIGIVADTERLSAAVEKLADALGRIGDAIFMVIEAEKEAGERVKEEKEEKDKKERENKVIDYHAYSRVVPVNVDILAQRKAEFYCLIDELVSAHSGIKNRSEALKWLYGKLNVVYGIVFDQLKKEVVPEYDTKKYSRVDLLCLSDGFYDIALNVIEKYISDVNGGRGSVGNGGYARRAGKVR